MLPSPTDHPTEEELRALSLGLVSEAELAELSTHLTDCRTCCRRIDEMVTDDPLLARLQRRAAHRGEGLVTPAQRRSAVLALRHGRQDQTPASLAATEITLESSPLPRQIGDYEVLSEIARGGMGVVYRASDPALGRVIAVKMLQDCYGPDSAAAHRFANEARITAQLQHPGIPPVHEVGALPDGRPFLAMKLIQGRTLEELLKERSSAAASLRPLADSQRHVTNLPPQDLPRFVAIFEAVCQAVAYAHAHGVIHRDLKPANVMVGSFGEVQVMDWGLAKQLRIADCGWPRIEEADSTLLDSLSSTESRVAKATAMGARVAGAESSKPRLGDAEPGLRRLSPGHLAEVQTLSETEDLRTHAGSVLGTPAYMPPEQALGALDEVDCRSDAFGLGAILVAILTGRPPFARPTAEATRVMAARGEVGECFARLDGGGADAGLVALCKRCLDPRRQDRPADAGEVARAVAELRAAADERARRAESEMAAAAARALERRKRRRLWLAAATALAVAVISGLSAVLVVQDRARRDLEAKNQQLENEQAKVENRFEMARKAIAAFHTTVEKDKALESEQFRPLRANLLQSAAGFYRELEGLLANETDTKSRKALADGYYQLGGLTERIGEQKSALGVYRQSLAIRRELAELPEAGPDARLNVAIAVRAVGRMLMATGDNAGALQAYEEARDLAAGVEAESPTDFVRQTLAHSHVSVGILLRQTGKPDKARAEYEKAQVIYKSLVAANPAVAEFQLDLGNDHNMIGLLWSEAGKPGEALVEYEKARVIWERLAHAHPTEANYQRALGLSHVNIGFTLNQRDKLVEALAEFEEARKIQQRLADANPAVTLFQSELGITQFNIGELLNRTGKPSEGLAAYERSREIHQRLAGANPAVTQFQHMLARNHHAIGYILSETGKPVEALAEYRKARDIQQRLADASPNVTFFQVSLAWSHFDMGNLLRNNGKPDEALSAHRKALAIRQKLADANPNVAKFPRDLGCSHYSVGQMLNEMGKPVEALSAHRKALAIRQKLAGANPTVADFQRDLAQSQTSIGRLHAQQGRFADAFTALDAALAILRPLTGHTSHVGLSLAYRGWAQARAGKPKEAADDLRRAVELWDKDPAPPIEMRFERARALALLTGLSAHPHSGVKAAEAKAFADRAVAALAEAVRPGSPEAAELKGPDFAVLRERDDFQKLVAALAPHAAGGPSPRQE
jgi:serine/threonine protein kinase